MALPRLAAQLGTLAVLTIAAWFATALGERFLAEDSMTTKEAVKLAHDKVDDHRDEIKTKFITNARPKELQKFMYGISAQLNNEYFNWAKIALDVRIARSLSWLTGVLVVLTLILVGLTVVLVVRSH